MNLGRYSKLIAALVGAVVLILTNQLGATSVYVEAVISVAAALGVYAVPNAV